MVIPPRPFGQVLNDAILSLGRTWKVVLVPALAVSVPISIATAVVFRVTGGAEFVELLANNPENLIGLPDQVLMELARPFYTALAISTILLLIGAVFVALVSHRAVASDLKGTPLTSRELSSLAFRSYGAGLGATLLVVIAVTVLITLGLTVWLMPAISVGTPNVTSRFVALILLAVLLAPGIWVAVSASMFTSAIVLEREGVLGSIRRSMRLVRGRWWPTAGYLLLVGALGGIAIQLIQLIALPLLGVGGSGGALAIASALGVLAQGLLVAAIAVMYTHWYVDLRARGESLTTSDLD